MPTFAKSVVSPYSAPAPTAINPFRHREILQELRVQSDADRDEDFVT
jgi:hypothetical protein